MVELLERMGDRVAAPRKPAVSPKRSAIVEAATALFLEAGYGAVSMDAIARRAGVSKRTVYSYFPGKEALFGAVMENVCASVIGTQTPAELTSGPLDRVLSEYGRRFLTLITSPQALAVFRVVTAEAVRFPELGQVFYRRRPVPGDGQGSGPYAPQPGRRAAPRQSRDRGRGRIGRRRLPPGLRPEAGRDALRRASTPDAPFFDDQRTPYKGGAPERPLDDPPPHALRGSAGAEQNGG